MKIWIFYLSITSLLLVFLFACNNGKKYESQKQYTKVEVYCFCMSELDVSTPPFYSICSTPSVIYTYNLIKPKYLYYSSDDKNVLNSLKKLFFEKVIKKDTLTEKTDARFVILLRKNNLDADTLVFNRFNGNTFYFNERNVFNYTFNVMDSVKFILKKDKIKCFNQ